MAFNRSKQEAWDEENFERDYHESRPISYPTPSRNGTTPSQSPFPVFALCQPIFVDTKIANNVWMKGLNGKERKIDKEQFMGEWYNLYTALSFNSLVYLIPACKGLQDQTYVNCAAYLPHLEKENVIILANFRAPGRSGEETVAGNFFKTLGYTTIRSPYKFEGEPELKYLKDNIYFGGYGIRTEPDAHKWIQHNFGAEIIPIQEKDEHLYHLDCTVFRLNKENVMVCTDLIDKETVKKIEKVANVFPVDREQAHAGICNSIQVGSLIFNSSSLQFMKKRDPKYDEEEHKNIELEAICSKLGYEVVFIEMSEAAKSGAALSCFVMHLNYRDD